jgi:hypothetical protein
MTREDVVFLTDLPQEECDVLVAIMRELHGARALHDTFHSAHEGYTVILEEVYELWAEVMKKREQRNRPRMAAEAIQIAAMGARFVLDICKTAKAVA